MDILKVNCHVAINDEIGGWAIVTKDVPFTSELRREDFSIGHRMIGDFLTEETAQHIVELHNAEL